MNLEKIRENSYPFQFIGGKNSSYVFVTEAKITYEVKFKPSNYLFEHRLDFQIFAYEFVIEIAINPTSKRPALDEKIPFSIASVFIDFFEKNERTFIVYVCDSSDSRQEARRRKFNQWVEIFKGNDFVKVDTQIIESPHIVYYNSIILRPNNPNRLQIVDAFINLANENQK